MDKVLTVLKLVPALIGAISSIEAMFPQNGAGAQKLELLKGIMQTSYDGIMDLWPSIEKSIALVVSLANALGTFRKS